MNDYSTILMRIEQSVKSLDKKCLNKQYDGYLEDMENIDKDLLMLCNWIGEQEMKELKSKGVNDGKS